MRQVPSGAADEPERAVSHSEEKDEDPPEDESVLVLADGPQMGDFASTSTPSAPQPLSGCSPRSCEGGAASAPDLTSAAAATGGEEGEQHCFSAYAVSPDFERMHGLIERRSQAVADAWTRHYGFAALEDEKGKKEKRNNKTEAALSFSSLLSWCNPILLLRL